MIDPSKLRPVDAYKHAVQASNAMGKHDWDGVYRALDLNVKWLEDATMPQVVATAITRFNEFAVRAGIPLVTMPPELLED
jgi:hypothetical protein